MPRFAQVILVCFVGWTILVHHAQAQHTAGTAGTWREALDEVLPEYGHRNWIAVVDSAYPSQSHPGIEIVVTHADQLEVVKVVLDHLAKSKHVRPKIYLDAELPFVPEKKTHGIEKYREGLKTLLADRKVESLPHEKIIDKLDAAGQKFNVLILKTNLTLPYTSVFIELDCGYWSDEAEKALRKAMADAEKK